MTSLTLRRPDDWHVHFRDGAVLNQVVPHTARHFGRAIVMPNLVPPVVTAGQAAAYRRRILAALPSRTSFTPLMTAYLTESTNPDDIAAGFADGILAAVKLYPAHATTNSHHGVSDVSAVGAVLERMQKIGMPLLVHGEVTDPDVDIFDREAVFIDRVLQPMLVQFPGLKVVMEHITTSHAADFVAANATRLGATITPQHLMLNRNALFAGGVRPHHFCLPVLKRETHRHALRKAATSGLECYFLGTDTAPHLRHLKENACGCAGIFSAPVALACYVTVFEEEDALDKFEAFASLNGPRFYGLPPNEERITLVRDRVKSDDTMAAVEVPGEGEIVVFSPPQALTWSIAP